LNEALDNGMSFMPGMPSVMLAVRGNRLAIFESISPPSSQSLATLAEFQSASRLYSKFPVSEVCATKFWHRDMLIDAMNTMRSEGNDLLGLIGDTSEIPVDFTMLPDAAELQALMPSAASVSIVDAEGFYSEGPSPFGRIATSILTRIPPALKMMSSFGLTSTSSEFSEEEF
jgi:hypothetical protein